MQRVVCEASIARQQSSDRDDDGAVVQGLGRQMCGDRPSDIGLPEVNVGTQS